MKSRTRERKSNRSANVVESCHRFELIKGGKVTRSVKIPETGQAMTGPFDRTGWKLLCHVEDPMYRKVSLFSREENGKIVYCMVDFATMDIYMAINQYKHMIDKLHAVTDVPFDDAFPKQKPENEKVFIKRQLGDGDFIEITNSDDGHDGFTITFISDGARKCLENCETKETALEIAEAFEIGYRGARVRGR